MYVRPISARLLRGSSIPAMRAITCPPFSGHFSRTRTLQPRTYPCRCLCRGFSQITRTTPARLMILHLRQICLTEARTFMIVVPRGAEGQLLTFAFLLSPCPCCSPYRGAALRGRLELAQHFGPFLSDCYRMFKVSGQAPVSRDRGPAIAFQRDLSSSDIDHGLNRQHHPFAQAHPTTAHTIIRDRGILVQAPANPMTDKLPHHRKPLTLDPFLNRCGDVAKAIADVGLRNPLFQGV